jgi:EAL and modified HD-GYP domain-containing signal transduction protein
MKTLPFSPRRPEAARSVGQRPSPVLSGGEAYIARQPILDGRPAIYGYELLFRAALSTESRQGSPESASARVLTDAVLAIGLDTLTQGRPAFVNIPRDSLLEGIPTLLPPQGVVVSLGDDVVGDLEAMDACRALKDAGYKIALGDFAFGEGSDFIPFADYIKIDLPTPYDAAIRADVLGRSGKRQPRLVAERIESAAQFDEALRDGFTYFQGFFFGQTVMRQAREIPARHVACLQLLNALNNPNLSVGDLEDIIKRDTMLSYRLLRAVSSAGSALPTGAPAVRSIRLALMMLGRDTVRRWASVWTMASLAEPGRGGQSELVAMSIIRARCCELLDQSGNDDGFLLGMCSLLDAILGQPLEALLGLLPLADDTRQALCGHQNPRRLLLDCVVAYERGHWDECGRLAQRAGVDPAMLPVAYREALAWTRGLDGTAA